MTHPHSDSPSVPPSAPRRVLGSVASFTLVSGSMLGIGIFIYPPEVAKLLGSAGPFLLVWAMGGLAALAGAVAYAELGAMFPRAGGDYEFLREGFGPSVSFAAGWLIFGAAFTGSIATMAVAMSQYQIPTLVHALPGCAHLDFHSPLVVAPFGGSVNGVRLVAVAVVLGVTWLNAAGARVAAWVQSLTTLVPLALMTILGVWALATTHALPAPDTTAALVAPRGWLPWLEAFVAAYMAVYFAYAGWNAVIYVAGEVRNPGKTIPRALLGGTLSVTALYLLLCGSFLHVFGTSGLARVGEAGSALAGTLGGPVARLIMTSLIAAAILSSINATILGGARVAYAMANRKAFWSWAAQLDPRHGVPRRALLLQAGWTCAYILTGTFEDIYRLTSLAMVFAGTLTVLSVYLLRRARPDHPRPYRTTGYPWLPALYVLSSVIVIATMLGQAVAGTPGARYPVAGLGIMLLAYLGHRYARRKAPQAPAAR